MLGGQVFYLDIPQGMLHGTYIYTFLNGILKTILHALPNW
jgi:hypothetical protein